ncbi:hypothetical protein [Chitinophaga ginsengisegetis]|uniref:hypothetical protein n=1 Tax=Chitinophaga ginsengisegetis TaxID=393003 RepID=UPI000DB99742|nr:hypothetical protein [Chitinophaga ginsengisegetis]MDR6566095.1 hypothetical protein [Chitinophaga ginsengisegetis]MDR6645824.1 hypothetical protein [Chitinophaga ginsengisegetis]MDR6651584.1 hypothetical protein [Chitinophaga ginsengisegetis]
MLQNRVNPFGNIIRTEARGLFMGNRGVIHNHDQEIIRPYKIKTWITCVLAFKNRRRPVMAPDRYTELFFMDEATSFAAGHRPCFECRKAEAHQFKSLWLKGNPDKKFNEKTLIKEIDNILHAERIDKHHLKVTFEESPNALPDGTFVSIGEEPYLLNKGLLYLWSPAGYSTGIPLPGSGKLPVLTPASVVNAFRAGYVPQMAV